MFIVWFFAGFLTASVIFTIFYKKNLGTLARARKALIDAWETVSDEAKGLFDGLDNKLDKEIEKRKAAAPPKPAPKPKVKSVPKVAAKKAIRTKK